MNRDPSVSNHGTEVIAARDVLSGDVYDSGMKRHGHVRDLLLDAQTGAISSAVLAYGGFLGMGEHRVTVPWQCLGLDHVQRPPMLPTAPEALKITLGPDRYKWLDVSEA